MCKYFNFKNIVVIVLEIFMFVIKIFWIILEIGIKIILIFFVILRFCCWDLMIFLVINKWMELLFLIGLLYKVVNLINFLVIYLVFLFNFLIVVILVIFFRGLKVFAGNFNKILFILCLYWWINIIFCWLVIVKIRVIFGLILIKKLFIIVLLGNLILFCFIWYYWLLIISLDCKSFYFFKLVIN